MHQICFLQCLFFNVYVEVVMYSISPVMAQWYQLAKCAWDPRSRDGDENQVSTCDLTCDSTWEHCAWQTMYFTVALLGVTWVFTLSATVYHLQNVVWGRFTIFGQIGWAQWPVRSVFFPSKFLLLEDVHRHFATKLPESGPSQHSQRMCCERTDWRVHTVRGQNILCITSLCHAHSHACPLSVT